MQAVSRRRYSLLGVKPGRAAYGDELHWPMSEKLIKVRERFPAVFAAQAANFHRVGAEDGGDFNIRNRMGSTRVRLADISSAYQSNVRSHLQRPNRKSNTITLRPRGTLVFGQRGSASHKLQGLRVSAVKHAGGTDIHKRICYGERLNDRYRQRNEPQNIFE